MNIAPVPDDQNKALAVHEDFYSIQGEGRNVGRPAVFLRTAGCNLRCGINGQWQCDTARAWTRDLAVMHSPEFLTKEFHRKAYTKELGRNAILVITGGEPLMQQEGLTAFLEHYKKEFDIYRPCFVEVETNGTIIPTEPFARQIDAFNVSPKLASCGEPTRKTLRPAAIEEFLSLKAPSKVNWKFVINDKADLDEMIDDYITPFALDPSDIWLMPAAETREQLLKKAPVVAEWSKGLGLNFSPRLHVYLWSNKEGV